MTIPKQDQRTPGRKNAPSIVEVARRGWDVARRSAKMGARSSCGPWEELPKEMQDALAQVATEGWLQGTQEGQEWARKGSYDNAPTDPHHGGKIFEPMNDVPNQNWWMIPTLGARDSSRGTYVIEYSDGIIATLTDGKKASLIVQAVNAYTSTEALPSLGELTSEGPIFAEDRFGAKLSAAADAYLEDYVYSPEEFVADHEPTEFEYQLLADFVGGLFADKAFSEILHSLIEKRAVLVSTDALRSALAFYADEENHGQFGAVESDNGYRARQALKANSSSPAPSTEGLRKALEKIAALADRNCGATDENFDYALGSAHAFTEAAAIARTALAGVTAPQEVDGK
jgi:hypothetical protein